MRISPLFAILAMNVRRLRKHCGLSQEKLAEKAGLHPTYISLIERRQCNISLQKLESIAESLNVTVVDMLTLKEERPEMKMISKRDKSH